MNAPRAINLTLYCPALNIAMGAGAGAVSTESVKEETLAFTSPPAGMDIPAELSCESIVEGFIDLCNFHHDIPSPSTPCSTVNKWRASRVLCLIEGMQVHT